MSISLVPIPAGHLTALGRGAIPAELAGRAFADGLPPPHVARRVARHLAEGKPARWVGMYYVLAADGCYVAGCGFKDVPREREVEVGYGVAAAYRGCGIASAALRELLGIATASGEVDAVIALIASDNPLRSTSPVAMGSWLVSRCGTRASGWCAGDVRCHHLQGEGLTGAAEPAWGGRDAARCARIES